MSKQLQVNNFDPHDSKNIDKLHPGSLGGSKHIRGRGMIQRKGPLPTG